MSDAVDELLKRWVRADIRAQKAYHVPDPGDMVKLDAMENPFGWPADMQSAWLEELRQAELNRYPDPAARELTASLQSAMQVPQGFDVLLGNGSDEIIQMLMLAMAGEGRCILAPEPTFVMYKILAELIGLEFCGVPLKDDFSLDMDAMRAAIEQKQPAIIWLACPNNPTGNVFARSDIEDILELAEGVVVVDEAYAPFTDTTFMQDLPKYPNLMVMRTVSKMGLAGLRLGLLAAAPAWIVEINKTRLPYNINILTQATASFALRHADVFADQAEKIRNERARLMFALQQLPDIEAFPSEANFILFRVPEGKATAWFEGLKAKGVLIKNMHGSTPALENCLRVTVGKPEETDAFLDALTSL